MVAVMIKITMKTIMTTLIALMITMTALGDTSGIGEKGLAKLDEP